MLSRLVGRTRPEREQQFIQKSSPILFTLVGITNDKRGVQFKTIFPIAVTVVGIYIDSKELQLVYELSGIEVIQLGITTVELQTGIEQLADLH